MKHRFPPLGFMPPGKIDTFLGDLWKTIKCQCKGHQYEAWHETPKRLPDEKCEIEIGVTCKKCRNSLFSATFTIPIPPHTDGP